MISSFGQCKSAEWAILKHCVKIVRFYFQCRVTEFNAVWLCLVFIVHWHLYYLDFPLLTVLCIIAALVKLAPQFVNELIMQRENCGREHSKSCHSSFSHQDSIVQEIAQEEEFRLRDSDSIRSTGRNKKKSKLFIFKNNYIFFSGPGKALQSCRAKGSRRKGNVSF